MATEKCFACGRTIRHESYFAYTIDDQKVVVGPECNRVIVASSYNGYQPDLGGPKLYSTRYLAGAATLSRFPDYDQPWPK